MGLMREHGDGRCPMYGQRMPDTMAEGPYCGRGPRVSATRISGQTSKKP